MVRYRVLIRESVFKDLDRIPKKDVSRIVKVIGTLSEDPRPTQSKKLSGKEKYRLRCGVYRVVYEILNKELIIYVVRDRHRRDVYR